MESAKAPFAFDRTLIMGNGGAGKTWLALRLAERLQHPVVHLDDVHWEPGYYGIARDKAVRNEIVKAAAQRSTWIMEGVYGELANMVLDRATTLVWIDLPEDECIINIEQRGAQGGESKTSFDGLLKWVAEYRMRTNNWNSFEACAIVRGVRWSEGCVVKPCSRIPLCGDRHSASVNARMNERLSIQIRRKRTFPVVAQSISGSAWGWPGTRKILQPRGTISSILPAR